MNPSRREELRKLILFGLAVAALLSAVFLVLPKLLGAAAGNETEVLTELKAAESRGLELKVGMAQPLVSTKASYDRISVNVNGVLATVTATLDFDGTVGKTAVSSLGAERVPLALEGNEWVPQDGWAPQLASVVRALELRRRALERGDPGLICSGFADGGESPELAKLLAVKDRKLRVDRWLIRSERDGVLVSEEWRLTGTLPERPVDERGTRRLVLQAAPGGEFCFPAGLM